LSKIVVGIDGSEASRKALRWAVHEAKVREAALLVVHTWPAPHVALGPNPRMGPLPDVHEAERRIADDLVERELEATGARAARIEIDREVVEGSPARTLLDAAEGADLLVLGSSRHGALAGVVLGAVGQQCIRYAPCPIVIVRAGGRDGIP
jgi:nucleotide-binding universal stress UspA family protein